MQWVLKSIRTAICAAVVWGLAATGPALAIETGDLLGTWEAQIDGDAIALEFRDGGIGVASEAVESAEIQWALDTTADPPQLRMTFEGNAVVSLIRLDTPDQITITMPDPVAPAGFDNAEVMTLRRAIAPDHADASDRPAQDQADTAARLLGMWDVDMEGETVMVEFREGGTGQVTEDGDSAPISWALDTTTDPLRLSVTLDGNTSFAQVRFDAPDKITLSVPFDAAPGSFDEVLVLRRAGN